MEWRKSLIVPYVNLTLTSQYVLYYVYEKTKQKTLGVNAKGRIKREEGRRGVRTPLLQTLPVKELVGKRFVDENSQ